jgi:cobalt-zinc-cadmium efflux system membrane fusion protein
MVPVQVGLSEDGYTQIKLPNGTSPDSLRLVVDGAYSLLSKMKNTEEGD